MIFSSGNTKVDQMARFNPSGVIIPHTWFLAIQKSGKPYMPAIVALAEIVYWYRPTFVKDEETGKLIGYRKRFKADLLQKSAGNLGDTFGFSKKQMLDALEFLKEQKLITDELRTIHRDGVKMNNVRYIDINVENIEKITYPAPISGDPITSKLQDPITSKSQGYDPQVIGLLPVSDTNTKITNTKITNNNDEEEEEGINQSGKSAMVNDDVRRVIESYQNNISYLISSIEQMKLIDDIDSFGADMVLYAIEIAVLNNARRYKYIERVFQSWREEKITTLDQAKARSKHWDESKGKRTTYKGGKPRGTSKRLDQSNEYASRGEW